MDFLFQNLTGSMNVFNFTILSGATRTFDLTIVDDSRAEFQGYYYDERVYYSLAIYNSSGRQIYCDGDSFYIEDNDGRFRYAWCSFYKYFYDIELTFVHF